MSSNSGDTFNDMGNYGGLRRNHDNSRRNGMDLNNKIETPCLKILSSYANSKFVYGKIDLINYRFWI